MIPPRPQASRHGSRPACPTRLRRRISTELLKLCTTTAPAPAHILTCCARTPARHRTQPPSVASHASPAADPFSPPNLPTLPPRTSHDIARATDAPRRRGRDILCIPRSVFRHLLATLPSSTRRSDRREANRAPNTHAATEPALDHTP